MHLFKNPNSQKRNNQNTKKNYSRNYMTTNSLYSFLNSFDNLKVKENKTTDSSTIDNYNSFRNYSKMINNIKKNSHEQSLSITNNKINNNPIKPNHKLILSEELSNNNNLILGYNSFKNNNNNIINKSVSPYNTIDLNNDKSIINNYSKMKLKKVNSKSDYNVSYFNNFINGKRNLKNNLVKIDNNKNEENYDSEDEKMFNSSDDENDNFILKRRKRNIKNDFMLNFKNKDSQNTINLDIENKIGNKNSSNFSIVKNDNFNISNNSKSRNINQNTIFSFSNESLDNSNNQKFFRKKHFSHKPKTLIMKNSIKLLSSQSENDENYNKKKMNKIHFHVMTDSENNNKKIHNGFISRLKSYHKNKLRNNEKYSKIFINSEPKLLNEDLLNQNIYFKKEQTPFQINQLKSSLLNKKYLTLSSWNYDNNENYNFNSSENESDDNNNLIINKNNNYYRSNPSFIENIYHDKALSLYSQEKNSYVTLSKDNSFIFFDEKDKENNKKKLNKRFLRQLSKIPEVKEKKNYSLFNNVNIDKNIEEKIFKRFIYCYSLPLKKIRDLNIKFLKKEKKDLSKFSNKISDSSYLLNSFISFKTISNLTNYSHLKSKSVKFLTEDIFIKNNYVFRKKKGKKLIRFLESQISENFNNNSFLNNYYKEKLLISVANYKNKQLEKIDDKIEEMIKIKSKETLRFKKELFTKKIINLCTQQRIINHFLKRTLLLTQFETLNLNLPLFIKRILIKKYLKINLYDQIIRSTYLLTDISNYNNEKTIIKNFDEKKKMKSTIRFKSTKTKEEIIILLPSEKYMNNFMISDSIEIKKKYLF